MNTSDNVAPTTEQRNLLRAITAYREQRSRTVAKLLECERLNLPELGPGALVDVEPIIDARNSVEALSIVSGHLISAALRAQRPVHPLAIVPVKKEA